MSRACILRYLQRKSSNGQEGHFLVSRRKKLMNKSDIPQHAIETIAQCILPDILEYYESEEGQKAFAEWMENRELKKSEKETT